MALEDECKKVNQAQREAEAVKRLTEKDRRERAEECLRWREKHRELADKFQAQEDLKALRQNKAVRRHLLFKTHLCCLEDDHQVFQLCWTGLNSIKCGICFVQLQARIKSYFLCMTESDQKIKILKNHDGTPRHFMVR